MSPTGGRAFELIMIVLGIDPGIARCGWGLVEHNASKLRFIDCGVFETPAGMDPEKRIDIVCTELEKLIKKHKPDEVAMEKVFFFKNQKTIIVTGQVQGGIMLVLTRKGYDVHQYTPLQVKQALTMYGRATKQQIQEVVTRVLNLETVPKPDDAADGLAIAITHAHTNKNLK